MSKTVVFIALLVGAIVLAIGLVQAGKHTQAHGALAQSSPPPVTAAPINTSLPAAVASPAATAKADHSTHVPSASTPASSSVSRSPSITRASSVPSASPAARTLSVRSGAAPSSPPGVSSNGLPPGVPYASDSDPVRIASVRLSSGEVHGGDLASAKVITTSNAAALTARIGTYQVNVPRTAPGTFAISIRVPRLPLVSQRVNIIITAIRTDGMTAQTTVPVKVSY